MQSDVLPPGLSDLWQSSLIESMQVGVVIVSRDYEVIEWNQFMQNHSGITIGNAKQQSLFTLFPDIDQLWLKAKCAPVFNMMLPVFLIWEQRHYLFKLKTTRPITSQVEFMYQNVSVLPILSNTGVTEYICFLTYDVTDQAIDKQQIKKLNAQLEKTNRLDGMTGLFNRRYWQEQYELSYKLAKRKQYPASVLILDIDHFKKVNDTYGHHTGDQVIKHVSALLQKVARETDVVGRYGGEEFVVLMPCSSQSDAKVLAERIREAVENSSVQHDGITIKVTVSVGGAEYTQEFKNVEDWLNHADACLYKAKNAGRNCSIF